MGASDARDLTTSSRLSNCPSPLPFLGCHGQNCTVPFALGLTCHVLSYAGTVNVCLASDTSCVHHPRRLAAMVLDELADLEAEILAAAPSASS